MSAVQLRVGDLVIRNDCLCVIVGACGSVHNNAYPNMNECRGWWRYRGTFAQSGGFTMTEIGNFLYEDERLVR